MNTARSQQETPSGILRIIAFATAAREIMSPLVLTYLQRYPQQVHIDIVTERRLLTSSPPASIWDCAGPIWCPAMRSPYWVRRGAWWLPHPPHFSRKGPFPRCRRICSLTHASADDFRTAPCSDGRSRRTAKNCSSTSMGRSHSTRLPWRGSPSQTAWGPATSWNAICVTILLPDGLCASSKTGRRRWCRSASNIIIGAIFRRPSRSLSHSHGTSPLVASHKASMRCEPQRGPKPTHIQTFALECWSAKAVTDQDAIRKIRVAMALGTSNPS